MMRSYLPWSRIWAVTLSLGVLLLTSPANARDRSAAAVIIGNNVAPGSEISALRYADDDVGWVGDVSTYRYDTGKIEALGYSPRHDSTEAVRTAVRRILELRPFVPQQREELCKS